MERMDVIYENQPNRPIICIDMRSFFASCAANFAQLDVMKDAIAVVGNLDYPGSIVLAASPKMKEQFRIKTGSRLFEIPKHPAIHLFEPTMDIFVKTSMAITDLLLSYVPKEAIHVYSIDESFVDLTGTEKLWGSAEAVAHHIQNAVYRQFGIYSAVGMGPNMLIAKLALDLEAKKTGFVRWNYEDIEHKLWPVRPLSEMWGIGRKMEKNLNNMGIFSVGGIARADKEDLKERFGVMGTQIYYHAWGLDLSTVEEAPLMTGQISYGKGQVLMRDYEHEDEIFAVMLEICEDVGRRTREAKKVGRTISLGISYSRHADGGGFQRAITIEEPTNDTLTIYKQCQLLFRKFHMHRPVRQIHISITKLEKEYVVQLDLFDNKRWKMRHLSTTMDNLRSRYGSAILLRAVSYTKGGTAVERANLLGGHKK